ncbi:DUF4232 domain-containing protein [Kribbella pratensis]|uniref:DUF4232 domain-containing protein n=1 Tax=Kribbella pratensis TaxID=2512112 RepID=UPI001066F54E|nr:DUF4232 domain-containing protein [Kribbella pratensis]
MVGGLVLLTSCGTEAAGGPGGGPTSASVSTPTPTVGRRTPTPPPPTCPASGAMITIGPVEPALGHRAVVLKLTNCRTAPITVNGYPDVAVLNARRRTMNVTIAHGTSYMARDPGPTRIRLRKGESALAAVSWSSTVEVAEDKASGTYLAVARHRGERPVISPVDTDLGTTAKVTLTAWCLKFPN